MQLSTLSEGSSGLTKKETFRGKTVPQLVLRETDYFNPFSAHVENYLVVEQATDLSDSNLNQIPVTFPVFPSITLITKTHEGSEWRNITKCNIFH